LHQRLTATWTATLPQYSALRAQAARAREVALRAAEQARAGAGAWVLQRALDRA
jgi:transcription initiation factor TFIID subunit TAF12